MAMVMPYFLIRIIDILSKILTGEIIMSTEIGHGSFLRRIAINVGAGYVPGINAVVMGAALAAGKMGWELVGIRDGFEGLLSPEKYPDGGLLTLSPQLIENLDPNAGGILGQAARIDPFNVRRINELEMVEEVDMSDELIKRIEAENIDGLISVVGSQGLTIIYKLHRKGLNSVCIPRSIDNDIASTAVSFGFNSALTFTIEMLDRARQAAQAARKIAVVEVQGEQAGWIALQAGIAVCADVVLIPEIPADLNNVATRLKDKISDKRPYGLVVVAQGAKLISQVKNEVPVSSLKASLSPLATSDSSSEYVIHSSGQAAQAVATGLQLLIAEETFPMVIGPWVRGGTPSAVDRQLGMAYGAGAIQALKAGKNGVMVSFIPPEIKFVPLAEAINKVRTVPAESEFLKIADSLGIYCGK
jgi:6-phosphofructokinase 1